MCEVGRDLYGVRSDFYENNPSCQPRTSTGTNNDKLCNYQDLKGLRSPPKGVILYQIADVLIRVKV